MPNFYNVGDVVRVGAMFKNIDLALTDPSTITFKIKAPDTSITTYVYGTDAALVREGVGVYHVDYTCTQSGTHVYEWIGTGAVTTIEDGYFDVYQKFF